MDARARGRKTAPVVTLGGGARKPLEQQQPPPPPPSLKRAVARIESARARLNQPSRALLALQSVGSVARRAAWRGERLRPRLRSGDTEAWRHIAAFAVRIWAVARRADASNVDGPRFHFAPAHMLTLLRRRRARARLCVASEQANAPLADVLEAN